MSGWTTAAELRAQMRRRWDRGDLLAEMVAPAALFPLRLLLRVPASADWSERFDEVRAWAAELQQGARAGYRLEERDVQHRVVGRNRLPHQAWADTLEDALRLAGKTSEARAFAPLMQTTRERQAALLHMGPRLLDMVGWLQSHPRPHVYLRQVDLPGIHSKFIEAQRSVLAELLDLALPADAIDAAFSGTARFARRYGFREKPLRVRLRFLDPAHQAWIPGTDADVTISQAAFERLSPRVKRVFVTENEINFLAFPPLADALVIFGAGYGVDGFATAPWLHECALHYWGDIDTHGFAILDQWRAHFPHARSWLMDHDTLLAHREQWTEEPQPTQRDLPRLGDDERRLYDDLRWRRLRAEPVRLEQERIGFGRVLEAVAGV
jgi:hypothetical protein